MKKNNHGFTLVELLTVVVLLGIVMMIAIPSLRNLTYNNSEQQYNYHVKFVEEAVKLYIKNYKGELEKDKASTCLSIPYQALLEEDLIEEEEISCEGNIILERRSREGYNHSYYLTCRDSSGKVVHASESMPLSCKGIGGKFVLNYSLYTDGESNQVPYTEGEWAQFVYGEYNASSPYNYPVEKIEYTTDLINWHVMTNRRQTYTNFNGNVFVRAIDEGGNVSEVVRHLIRTDSKVPVVGIKASSLSLGNEDYDFTSNLNIDFGPSGGNTVCNPATSRKTGTYTVTCTSTSNANNQSTTVSFTVGHSYAASHWTTSSSCCISGGMCTQPAQCLAMSPSECISGAYHGPSGCSICTSWKDAYDYPCCTAMGTCTEDHYSCPNGGTLSGTTCYY